MMYFITTIEEKDGKVKDTRCVGYVDTFEEAEKIGFELAKNVLKEYNSL